MHVDPERLAQAIDNLLDNAARHGVPPIGLVGTADDGGVRIQVTDSGPGIPSELVSRLFQPFAYAGSSGGTGLGLSLVREIARRHGGEAVYVPPEDGERSAFEIRLPQQARAGSPQRPVA
jgi:signal transduction histidine kinase